MAKISADSGLTLPYVPEWAEPAWHLFVVRHAERDLLQQKLAETGIGTLIHYPVPPHLSGAYHDAGFGRGSFPIAEQMAEEELSLPLHPHLTWEQVEEIVGSVCLAACLPLRAMA